MARLAQLPYFLNDGNPLYTEKHSEDSLLAFTCPALWHFRELVLLHDPMFKLLHLRFYFWGAHTGLGIAMLQPK